MPQTANPLLKATPPALSEPESKALSEFLRVSGAKGSAQAIEERLLMSLTFAYRRHLTSN